MTTRFATRTSSRQDPTYQAFALLRTVFTIAPILFGLDKFFNVLTDWTPTSPRGSTDIVPGDAADAMQMVGVVEIAAGLLVALRAALRRATSWRSGSPASSSTC